MRIFSVGLGTSDATIVTSVPSMGFFPPTATAILGHQLGVLQFTQVLILCPEVASDHTG